MIFYIKFIFVFNFNKKNLVNKIAVAIKVRKMIIRSVGNGKDPGIVGIQTGIDSALQIRNLQTSQVDCYRIRQEPFYLPINNEVRLFEAAYAQKLNVLLKGPTGCGKTRFVEYMAFKLGLPLFTVSCHEDLTANDLVGRLIIKGGETEFIDGPLTLAARYGGIAYLDEIVEARKDSIVAIHPLADHRRQLPIEKIRTVIDAHPNFLLVCTYNPGYQSIIKDMKPSTKQRFIGVPFDYPDLKKEEKIIIEESGVDADNAKKLVRLGEKVRNLKDQGIEEGASTRLLVYASKLIVEGIDVREAIRHAVIEPVTDDSDVKKSIEDLVDAIFGSKKRS